MDQRHLPRPNHIRFLSSSDEDEEPPVKKSIFDSMKRSENNSKPTPKHIVFVDSSDDEKEPSVSKLRFDSTIDYESKSVKKKKKRSRYEPPIDPTVERSRSDSIKKSKKNTDEMEESPTKEVSPIDLIVMKSNSDSTKKNKKNYDQNQKFSVEEASPVDTVVHKSKYYSTKMSKEKISDQKIESSSDEVSHVESVVKRSRSDSMINDDKNLSYDIDQNEESSSEENQVTVVRRNRGVPKRNETELRCPECKEFRSCSVKTFVSHLKRKHSTTLGLAGFFLRCDCGHESRSEEHLRKCTVANYTVIRKKDGPILTFNDKKVTPQCFLCEVYPKTAEGYAQHLELHHDSSLRMSRRYLICSCGLKVTSHHIDPTHRKKCDGRMFTMHKLNEE